MTVQKCHKVVKIFKIMVARDNIWNHHVKCIQISTNVPGIGPLICEIHVKITEQTFRHDKPHKLLECLICAPKANMCAPMNSVGNN